MRPVPEAFLLLHGAGIINGTFDLAVSEVEDYVEEAEEEECMTDDEIMDVEASASTDLIALMPAPKLPSIAPAVVSRPTPIEAPSTHVPTPCPQAAVLEPTPSTRAAVLEPTPSPPAVVLDPTPSSPAAVLDPTPSPRAAVLKPTPSLPAAVLEPTPPTALSKPTPVDPAPLRAPADSQLLRAGTCGLLGYPRA